MTFPTKEKYYMESREFAIRFWHQIRSFNINIVVSILGSRLFEHCGYWHSDYLIICWHFFVALDCLLVSDKSSLIISTINNALIRLQVISDNILLYRSCRIAFMFILDAFGINRVNLAAQIKSTRAKLEFWVRSVNIWFFFHTLQRLSSRRELFFLKKRKKTENKIEQMKQSKHFVYVWKDEKCFSSGILDSH